MHPKLNYLVDLYDTRESTVSFVAMIRSMGQVQGGNKYRIYRSHVLSFFRIDVNGSYYARTEACVG